MGVKVIPEEEAASAPCVRHDDLYTAPIKRKFTTCPKVWKLRDPQTCSRFQEVFKAHVTAVETEAATTTEEI